MTKLPYPSTAEDFRREYASHSREELLHAVADLHVLLLGQAKLKDSVEWAAMMLAKVTSSDGSGHADLARVVLVKAGATPEQARETVDAYIEERAWGKPIPPVRLDKNT